MSIKKILLFTFILFLSVSLLVSAVPQRGKKKAAVSTLFEKGGKYLTAQIGINSWAIPFGASFEVGITENIGVGGTVMMWFWSDVGVSESVIVPEANVTYHFTKLKVDKLDVFAGAGVGYAIYHVSIAGWAGGGGSGIYIDPFIAGRYYFSEKMAASLRLNIGLIGSWSGVGAQAGVTFRL